MPWAIFAGMAVTPGMLHVQDWGSPILVCGTAGVLCGVGKEVCL